MAVISGALLVGLTAVSAMQCAMWRERARLAEANLDSVILRLAKVEHALCVATDDASTRVMETADREVPTARMPSRPAPPGDDEQTVALERSGT